MHPTDADFAAEQQHSLEADLAAEQDAAIAKREQIMRNRATVKCSSGHIAACWRGRYGLDVYCILETDDDRARIGSTIHNDGGGFWVSAKDLE